MASSSSSQQEIVEHDLLSEREGSVVSPESFDVFINHRGPDVKETLAARLYDSLRAVGCKPFLDSEELKLGDIIPSTLKNAICSASVQIAIFSPRYAESTWALTELQLMLETEAMFIPVFYNVKAKDLQDIKKGNYAKAFSDFETEKRNPNQLEKWKKALKSASLVSGFEFSDPLYSLFHEKIVSAVQQEVARRKPLDVAKHKVGLDELVGEFESLCQQNEDENFQIIGIFGMVGSGKTTLAKEFFNRKRLQYSGSCFVSDVGEAYAKGEMRDLQSKILKDLVKVDITIQSISDRTTAIRHYLERTSGNSRFLIVVDDISRLEQLDALPFRDVLKHGSLLIVTTRDERLLTNAGITLRYNMKQMDTLHAKELFCWHAFGQSNPANGYEGLVESFAKTCGGLPLSLRLLGGHVYGSDKDYWELELAKVRKMLPDDLKQKLKMSFDALDKEEKQIFMDIACFFIGKPKTMAIRIWKASGWSAEHALQRLKDKCLVEVRYEVGYVPGELVLNMHNHFRDLGRELADELPSPLRLWRPQDLISLGSKGFRKILQETNGRCFHSIFDSSMDSKITYFIGNSNNCAQRSTILLWLELDLKQSHQVKNIPSWIPLQNLECLKIIDGRLQRLWREDLYISSLSWIPRSFLQFFRSNAQVPSQLKELIIDTTVLRELPNTLGTLNYLENLTLKGSYSEMSNSKFIRWEGRSVSDSLKKLCNLRNLVLWDICLSGELTLSNGRDAASFESSIGNCMSSLKTIQIRFVKLTSKISISGEHCPSLESLRLDSMEDLNELDLNLVTTLESLKLMYCRKLKTVSGNLDLGKLATFEIKECLELEELPSLAQLSYLEMITIGQCPKLRNIRGIEDLEGLKYLYISTGNGGADVWNCIQRLKRLPSEFTTVIGKAVDEAEFILNPNFFSSLIDAEAVTDSDSKLKASAKLPDSISVIIICALIHSTHEGKMKTPVTPGK